MKLLSAQDFSGDASRFPFGIDRAKTATALRKLASELDKPESGIVMRGVVVYSNAVPEDYVLTSLVLKWVQKSQPRRRAIKVKP